MKQIASGEHFLLASREFIESKLYWLQYLSGICRTKTHFYSAK